MQGEILDYITKIQRSIDFIEDNITGDLELNEIAKEACFSLFHFHRIFFILTGNSVKDYIRKRRLSLACKELAYSSSKVIDLALKYGYKTPESFSKAFKKMFSLTPIQMKRNGWNNSLYFERLKLLKNIGGKIMLNYKILEKDSFKIIGKELTVSTENGENFKLIPKFWEKCMKDGTLDILGKIINKPKETVNACLGLCMDFKNQDNKNYFSYLICIEVNDFSFIPDGMETRTIPKQKYAVFTVKGKMPESIQKTTKEIYQNWFPKSGYERADGADFELYDERSIENNDNAEVDIYIPVK